MHESPVLCARTLAEASGGNVVLKHELLELFMSATGAAAAALEVAFAAGSREQVRKLAHLMNGRSRVVGAVALAQACERLEHLARAGDWMELQHALEGFQDEWTAVRDAIHRTRS
jgi:HPt (histidine-containing phosphotransfer) domain-containing protein